MQRPYVFVSYSHDSESFEDDVREFVNRLRIDGVRCEIDQFYEFPPEGWPRWMDKAISDAERVLLIISDGYAQKLEMLSSGQGGSGVAWEVTAVYDELYKKIGHNDKFIPIVFSSSMIASIPSRLQGYTHFDVSKDSRYEALLAFLTGQNHTYRAPVGAIREVQQRGLPDSEDVHSFEALDKLSSFPISPFAFASVSSGSGLTCVTTNLDLERIRPIPNCSIRVKSTDPRGLGEGSRILLRFSYIPKGCRIGLPGEILKEGRNRVAAFVEKPDARGAHGWVPKSAHQVHELEVHTAEDGFPGYTQATYEVERKVETLDIPVIIAWNGSCPDEEIGVGSIQVSTTLAPVSRSLPPEPGTFVDTGFSHDTLFSLLRCTTVLLFPFVANFAHFYTVIKIVNTSRDYFGSNSHTGSITLYFHSNDSESASPPEQTSTTIVAGESLTFDSRFGNGAKGLTGIPAGFSGYVFAACEFGPAHGMGFQFSEDDDSKPLFSYEAKPVRLTSRGIDQWPNLDTSGS